MCISFCVLSPIEQSKADTVINKLPWTIGVPEGGDVENLVGTSSGGEDFNMATPDEIRESELGNKAKILGCCLRRSPSTDVWAADYGCLLVYETPDCSGTFRRFENLDQVEDFLVKREQSGT